MNYQWTYRQYDRPFSTALRTAHGTWESRRGYIIRMVDEDGATGYGEVAPLDGFGGEAHAEARVFLDSLDGADSPGDIPADLPCCRFAFASALGMVRARPPSPAQVRTACLLPSGEDALAALRAGVERGFTTFKWKIGVKPAQLENRLLEELCAALPPGGKLRLDANASLTLPRTISWLNLLERHDIEFLEQPMPVGTHEALWQILGNFKTPVALDESVSSMGALEALKDWPGPLVVKPALMGAPAELAAWKQANPKVTLVYSSVFETLVGMQSVLQIAASDATAPVSGLGTQAFFPEGDPLSHPAATPSIATDTVGMADMDRAWETLQTLHRP